MTVAYTNGQICFYLLISCCCHVAVMYSVGSIAYAVYSLEGFDGTIPFNFNNWIYFERCCSFSKEAKVNLITMLVSYPVSGFVFGLLIPGKVWDFSITTTLVHVVLSCLVMVDFPTNWTWWICLGISCLMMIGVGEIVSFLRKCRNRNRLVVPEKTDEAVINYLQR